jgi:hypothetical protein
MAAYKHLLAITMPLDHQVRQREYGWPNEIAPVNDGEQTVYLLSRTSPASARAVTWTYQRNVLAPGRPTGHSDAACGHIALSSDDCRTIRVGGGRAVAAKRGAATEERRARGHPVAGAPGSRCTGGHGRSSRRGSESESGRASARWDVASTAIAAIGAPGLGLGNGSGAQEARVAFRVGRGVVIPDDRFCRALIANMLMAACGNVNVPHAAINYFWVNARCCG